MNIILGKLFVIKHTLHSMYQIINTFTDYIIHAWMLSTHCVTGTLLSTGDSVLKKKTNTIACVDFQMYRGSQTLNK